MSTHPDLGMRLDKNWTLFAFVIFGTALSAYLTPGMSQTGALMLLPLILLPIRSTSTLRLDWSIWLLLGACLGALLVHFQDGRSVLNLLLMGSTMLALSFAARYAIVGEVDFVPVLCRACEWILWLSIALSLVGTALHLPIAPPYFPWEAITSDVRMHIMGSENLGHTSSVWLATFAIIGRLTAARPLRVTNLLIVSCMAVILVFSKSRISLIMLGFVALGTLLQSLRVRPQRSAALVVLAAWLYFAGYFVAQLHDGAKLALENQTIALQEKFPELRIAAIGAKSALFSGREALNNRLLRLIDEAPWTGVGQSDPILNVSYSTTPMAYVEGSSESPLRLPAKYGIPFAAAFLVFLLRGTWAVRKSLPAALILSCVIATSASEATFEVLQTIGGLFFFFAILCIEQARCESKTRQPRSLAFDVGEGSIPYRARRITAMR